MKLINKIAKTLAIMTAISIIICYGQIGFASEADELKSGIFTYKIINGEITITRCDVNASGAVTVPDNINGKPVTVIGERAFSLCNKITKLTITDTVTLIDDCGITNCSELVTVELGAGIAEIGFLVFENCYKLTQINVNINNKYFATYEGVLYSKDMSALVKCPQGKSSVLISDKVKTVKSNAFAFCEKLKNITLPDSLEIIEYYAFDTCTGLTEITIPDSVKSIGQQAFEQCYNITEINLGKSVETIELGAFLKCKAENIIIPDSLSYLGNNALPYIFTEKLPNGPVYLGKLFYAYKGDMPANTKFVIKDGTKGIAGGAFWLCKNLIDIVIPESVTQIADMAFGGCTGLTSLKLPGKIKTIHRSSIGGCSSLTELVIPNGVTKIGRDGLSGCTSLETITIPDSVYMIEMNAFSDTKWMQNKKDGLLYAGKVVIGYKGEINRDTLITIEEGTKGIAECAFSDNYFNGFPKIVLPKSVEYIGSFAFPSVNLTITNPNTVIQLNSFGRGIPTLTSDPGSTAQQYAYDNDFDWIPLSLISGDTDLNGKVEVEDARLALRNAVDLEVLDLYAIQCGDLDENGLIEIEEARTILRRAVGLE